MSNVVIKAENISKQYRLGTLGTGTLSHDLNRWWHLVRGKEDPYLKIGQTNDRTKKADSEYVWSLKDINFEIKQGDVVGIIGRNGAGKSTLLKILSRVTTPTTGEIKVKGRIASLLEVGTGFHPELTGRENIFLNGAILGMTKAEIRSKLDEIIDFAGIERYIDTPVKRYSSGMYVRLAFAVAAHLEPEILVVDEVLAVGDAEFQKKCLGKMKDVSTQGRTVLFVSHNISAIKALCNKIMLMRNGQLAYEGYDKEKGIGLYHNSFETVDSSGVIDLTKVKHVYASEIYKYTSISFVNSEGLATPNIKMGEAFDIKLEFEATIEDEVILVIEFLTLDSTNVVNTYSYDNIKQLIAKRGKNKVTCNFNPNILFPNEYVVNIWILDKTKHPVNMLSSVAKVTVDSVGVDSFDKLDKRQGLAYHKFTWKVESHQ
jgi:lipopolysaccharide transport system ATP-binding protein